MQLQRCSVFVSVIQVDIYTNWGHNLEFNGAECMTVKRTDCLFRSRYKNVDQSSETALEQSRLRAFHDRLNLHGAL